MTHAKDTKITAGKPRRAARPSPLQLASIAKALLNNAEYVLGQWLPDGELQGNEWVARNPTRDDAEPGSFKINTVKGAWADFATGDKGGDLFSLYQYLNNGTSDLKARNRLSNFVRDKGLNKRKRANASDVKPTVKKSKKRERPPAEPIKPDEMKVLPPDVDPAGNSVTASWEYRTPDGSISHYVLRMEPDPGQKEVKPVMWLESKQKWLWRSPAGPLPLFNSDLITPDVTVLFGEGEKVAEYLNQFPDAVGVTSCGGSGRLLESDLSPLENAKAVRVFPDADMSGNRYAAQVMAYCMIHQKPVTVVDVQALGWSNGEDAADHPEMSMADYEPYLITHDAWIDAADGNRRLYHEAFFQVAGRMDEVEFECDRKKLASLLGISVNFLKRKVNECRIQEKPESNAEEVEEELTPEEIEEIRADMYPKVKDIAENPDILKLTQTTLQKMGVVGESGITDLTYLAVTSRLSKKPVNPLIKGSSSSGKSFTTQSTLKLFPDDAYHTLTGGSAKSLIYSQEDFSHRMLVILEATQLNNAGDDDPYSMFLRTLISEGYIRYETVEKNESGQLETRVIMKDGPTGLILTTTADHIHHENETRMLSAYPDESEIQTKAIINQIAEGYTKPGQSTALEKELENWHQFHEWVSMGNHNVIIPFMPDVTNAIPSTPVRFRRDISQLASLIQTSAIIHQATRETNGDGCLVATLEDYRIAREVIIQSLQIATSEALNPRATNILKYVYSEMSDEVRGGKGYLSISSLKISSATGIPRQTVNRQMEKIIEGGYLKNAEQRPKKPMRLKLGDDFSPLLLSDSDAVLPAVDHLRAA